MFELAIYFIKVNVIVTLAFLFYPLLFNGQRRFRQRRAYLLAAVPLSLTLPLLSNLWSPILRGSDGVLLLPAIMIVPGQGVETSTTDWFAIILATYLTVTAFLILRTLWRALSIRRLIRHSVTLKHNGLSYHRSDAIGREAFSWFNHIFLPDGARVPSYVIDHERQHALGHHTVDILLSELFTAMLWVNPAIWAIRRDIRDNLEYIADSAAMTESNRKEYQLSLIGSTITEPVSRLYSSFNFNLNSIKKRIKMMNSSPKTQNSTLRYMLTASLSAAFLFVASIPALKAGNSSTETTAPAEAPAPTKGRQVEETMRVTKTVSMSTGTEKDTEFPGGVESFFKYIAANLRYPASAAADNVEGKVICSFIVAPDGKVTKVKVVKGVREDLDKAALEVLKNSPKWIPAKPGGDNEVVVPINFRLPRK